MRRTSLARTLHAAVAGAAVLLLAAPASALAASQASISGATLTIQGDGAANSMSLSRSGNTFTIAQGSPNITAGSGCTQASPSTVTCPAAGIAIIEWRGGDGADMLTVNSDLQAFLSMDGEGGNDQLHGGLGSEDFLDSAGDDVYTGDGGDDFFLDGPGDDSYSGQGGADTFVDSDGNDSYQGSDDNLFPQPVDTVDFSVGASGVNVTLDGVANDGPSGSTDNVMSDIETVVGTSGDDSLTAPSGGVSRGKTLVGLEGNDTITGGPFDDLLDAGDGNDVLTAGEGSDDLEGGDGDDRLSGGPGDDLLVGATGNDALGGDAGDDVLADVQGNGDMFGGDGEDTAIIAPVTPDPTGPQLLPLPAGISLDDQANDGASGESKNVHSDVENVVTGDGDDKITGSAAPNRLDGGVGNDQIDGLAGIDTLKGGRGDDRIVAVDQGSDVVNCAEGTDTASGDAGDSFLACENLTKVPAPAPPDTVKPQVTISSRKTITRRSFRSGLRVKVTTNEPATVVAELLAAVRPRERIPFAAAVGDVVIGRARLPLGTGTRALRIKPSRQFARRVRDRRLRLTVQLTATDRAGNVRVVRRKVRVR